MSPADFREVIRLLDSAVSLFERSRHQEPARLRRHVRALTLEFDLLRVRLAQPAGPQGRN
jgi:hypothetical protein